MKIHEYQAAELFKKFGIPVLSGEVATTLNEAQSIAEKIGFPVVLKSQVLVGGRGKAGGIKVVKTAAELSKAFPQLKALNIKGYPVERIFVVQAIAIKKEFYVAITIDPAKNDIVLIASSAGGVDIEETAKQNSQAIHKLYLNANRVIDQARLTLFVKAIFPDAPSQKAGAEIFQNLLKLFCELDCSLAEINPLAIDDRGNMVAADAKINFDDNALFRHEDIQKLQDVKFEDADEMEAKQAGLSFVKLDGNVGCVVNGAGLAMATLDVVKLLGGDPANFLDVGGSSSPQKVLTALKIILKNKKTKSILVNIFGGITRCDDIANGILEARKQLEMRIPMVVRLTGTNEELAKEILAKAKISTCSSMREAVEQVVALARQG
ncbi:MAG: succinate--CoA ligase subunit beta [Omnitrophica WOR_2 bacterium RIFCSPHIGHO2_01_FULL_48_9]|nr:MAG: succinate--CoA ligase subunit beta [Omnitrophica WOR_2 bacterium RIFCSPHIGHO2_02_FULL_48_11]OGX30888.1 MAG: succinate--CoA ligase subunit beta [Omnitrophica WOR_2 bacterium RIFCSPHIGHO2_01_FULL_48_9]